MRRTIAAGLLAGVAAILVVLSGVIPLEASSGHWAVTSWLLDFAKRRSVATRSLGVRVPPLDDPTLVLKGAGHYDIGCRPCHGSPGQVPPTVPSRMTPPPPALQQQVARWRPRELFFIVRHGIKFTGMPAWPTATRDDEVWAVVAFLRALPRMNAETYGRLVTGGVGNAEDMRSPLHQADGPSIVRIVRARCAQCHGADGGGRERPAFPRLAGQRTEYLRLAMRAYASGARHSGTMTTIASGLDANTTRRIAEYYGSLPPAPVLPGGPAAQRGADIATQGVPSRRVPPCVECHGPAPSKRNPAYPRLAGQFAEYLSLQLRLLAESRRGGSPYAHIMRRIAPGLTPEQMQDVAAYYASLSGNEADFHTTGSSPQHTAIDAYPLIAPSPRVTRGPASTRATSADAGRR